MLPEEFPNPKCEDIYTVLRGGISNVHITSAQEFGYHDMSRSGDCKTVRRGISMSYRIDDLVEINIVLNDLSECNQGVVDWSMVLEQGQRAFSHLKDQLAGTRPYRTEVVLRFTKKGEIYLPRKG